jgi:hypothetical protein
MVNDSSPERRNLLITSLAFIAFYGGGAEISSNELRLVLVDASFSRSYFLAIMVWIAIGWFALRFWQKSDGEITKNLRGELVRNSVPDVLACSSVEKARAALVDCDKNRLFDKEVVAEKIWYFSDRPSVICVFIDSKNVRYHSEVVPLTIWQIMRYSMPTFMAQVVKGNAFQEELIPYILFLAAISGPLWSVLL